MIGASHHPPDEMLVAYGAGSLDEAGALLVATHLTLCPRCRAEVAHVEALGGQVMDELPPTALSAGALDAVLAVLNLPAPVAPPPARKRPSGLPAPLAAYVGDGLDTLPWKRLGRGIEQVFLLGDRAVRARLLRVAPGVVIPRHGHAGLELTLVLAGGFADQGRAYDRGDVEVADRQTVHAPAADAKEGCLCLAVTDAPLRLTGLLGLLINPFVDL
jgi:putative transcriptional regulator